MERNERSATVRSTLQKFCTIEADLNQRIEDLRVKRELLQAQQNGEMVTVWMMDNWGTADSLRRYVGASKIPRVCSCKIQRYFANVSFI